MSAIKAVCIWRRAFEAWGWDATEDAVARAVTAFWRSDKTPHQRIKMVREMRDTLAGRGVWKPRKGHLTIAADLAREIQRIERVRVPNG